MCNSEDYATNSVSTSPIASTAEFGSHTWNGARWQGHNAMLAAEITRLAAAFEQLAGAALDELLENPQDDDANERQAYQFLKHTEAQALIHSLGNFAAALFDFFYEGFYAPLNIRGKAAEDHSGQAAGTATVTNQQAADDSNQQAIAEIGQMLSAVKAPLFYASQRFSPNFVLRTLIEQAYHDLNLLQQIYSQRSAPSALTANTLLIAEELGRRALAPALPTLFGAHQRNVFSYLGNRLEVRLLPYVETVLLGVPHITNTIYREANGQAMADPIALTAIPHEIGHVVFRFGQTNRGQGTVPLHRLLRNRLLARLAELMANNSAVNDTDALDDWRFHWLEEIFADAYGCLVAGPISVLGFQVMLADGPPQSGQEHAGDHPIPVLRPLIQSRILRKIGLLWGMPMLLDASDRLDDHWQQWVVANWPQLVAEWWLNDEQPLAVVQRIRFVFGGHRLTGQQILDALEPVIDVVLQTLDPLWPVGATPSWTPTWQPTIDQQNVASLYHEYVRFADQLATDALAAGKDAFQMYDGPTQGNRALLALLHKFAAEGIDGWRARSGGIDSLIEVLLFEGWSEEGPQGEHER